MAYASNAGRKRRAHESQRIEIKSYIKGESKMSKTEENIKAAFAGESQARNKYTFFAEMARKEGYHYIAKIFEETAFNEMEHAKDHFNLLNGIGTTEEN